MRSPAKPLWEMNFFRKTLCVLSLGSNRPFLGRTPLDLLGSAGAELGKFLSRCRISSVYKTAPLHVDDQDDFLNACVSGYFGESPERLLALIQAVEAAHGRNRAAERRWGERSLDIDILLFGSRIIKTPDLTVPHPRLPERAFALRPLLELLPQAREPGTGKPYRAILEALPDQGVEVFTRP
jgi:2-amino-4-hydroxy-6-hydroxymethyldihydropteridine diphosphokinase